MAVRVFLPHVEGDHLTALTVALSLAGAKQAPASQHQKAGAVWSCLPAYMSRRCGVQLPSLGVVLPHLPCEIFRANFSPFLSIFARSPGQFSQV